VAIGRIEHVGDVGEAILEYANFSDQRLHASLGPVDASLLIPKMRRHGGHWASFLMLHELRPLSGDGTADNCTLTWDNDLGAGVLDVVLEVETKDIFGAVRTGRGSMRAGGPLVFL
jgi:hypothetical protein